EREAEAPAHADALGLEDAHPDPLGVDGLGHLGGERVEEVDVLQSPLLEARELFQDGADRSRQPVGALAADHLKPLGQKISIRDPIAKSFAGPRGIPARAANLSMAWA